MRVLHTRKTIESFTLTSSTRHGAAKRGFAIFAGVAGLFSSWTFDVRAEGEASDSEAAAPSEGAKSDSEPSSAPLANEAKAASESPTRHGSVSLDPLGFLLFGPRVSAEVALGPVSVGARFRWFDVGLLSQALFLDTVHRFAFSFGAALEGRYYFSRPLEGGYAGVTVEVLRTSIEYPAQLTVANSLYLVPQLTGGYRFSFGSFFVDPSLSLGYAAQLEAKAENMPGGTLAALTTIQNKSSVYASAGLDVGIFF